MTPKSFEIALRGMQTRKPFRSFTIELMSGDRIIVDHPEAVIFRGGVGIYLSSKGVMTLFDHHSVTQLIGESRRASA